MAVPTQPNFIPQAWASGTGNFDTIPATQQEAGRASWDGGFPLENTIPVAQGGVPANYRDFQGVLNALSSFAWWQQRGGLFTYSNQIDYPVGAIVNGDDGFVYQCLAENGPGTTSGVKALSQTAFWAQLVCGTQDQTIRGVKVFTGNLISQKANPYVYLNETDFEKGQGQAGFSAIYFHDKNESLKTAIVSNHASNGLSYTAITTYPNAGSELDTGKNVQMYITTGGTGYRFQPGSDNDISLGGSSNRWKEIFAASATINTSDERQKQDVTVIPDAVLDAWGDVDWQQFRFKASVAEKGESARMHSGIIAQRVAEAFASRGLDASAYGLFCHDSWDAQEAEYIDIYDEDENGEPVFKERVCIVEEKEAGDLFAIRYEEALSMEAAYQRRRADRLEERIARLEALLNAE